MNEKQLTKEQLRLKGEVSQLSDELRSLKSDFKNFTKMVSSDMKKVITMVNTSKKKR